MRLQTALACGSTQQELCRAAASLLIQPAWNHKIRDLARYLARDWARDWARYWARYLARYLARDWNIKETDWLGSYASIDLLSFGRVGARTQMDHAKIPEDLPEGLLLAVACRLSLHPDGDSAEFEAAIERYAASLDPLWPALARHLARRSTAEDRALLVDLARHPEKREPPLSWGLQFIVR
ncbi:MAG: hypothetical protein GY856_50240, partial [bacterium]|nr:hypothetical protein [bacterium]